MQLLISIQSSEEVSPALAGGADILDLKDPARGGLGRIEDHRLYEICESLPANIPLSMALGEITDQNTTPLPLPECIEFAKAGPAGLASFPDWQSTWSSYLDHTPHRFSSTGGWVAVIYADHLHACSPPGEEILRFAREKPFRGILVDTFRKDGRSLFDYCSAAQLREWNHVAHEQRQFFALAGSLRTEHIPTLREIRPDIVAVRGAVCSNHVRTSALDSSLVHRFKQSLLSNSPAALDPLVHSPN